MQKLYIITTFLILVTLSCDKIIPEGFRYRYNDRPIIEKRLNNGMWGKFNALKIESNGKYNNKRNNDFDFYRPQGNNERLPLIIFVHSGGFVTGDKCNYIITKYCQDFCRAGYAVASINYRLIDLKILKDWKNIESLINKSYTRKKIMEAVGDVRQATSFFKLNSDKYNIDPEQVFLVGYSAGAIITNHFAFSTALEAKEYVEKGENFVINAILGQKEIDNIDAFSVSSANLVKGVVSIAGGIMDYDHIEDSELSSLPVLMIHGTNDQMVPFGYDDPLTVYSNKDIKIDLPGIYFELGVKKKLDAKANEDIVDNELQIRKRLGIYIPKWIFKQIFKMFTTQVCGSGCIKARLNENLDCKVVEIEGAPHVFMLNENGTFNRSYLDTRNIINKFIKRNSKNYFKQNEVKL